MITGTVFWALILIQEPGVLQEVWTTREPCEQQVEKLKDTYTPAACIPTTWADLETALIQLRALGTVMDTSKE